MEGSYFPAPPSPPIRDERMKVITNPNGCSSPWHFPVVDHAGRSRMASVVAQVPIIQSQFSDVWLDLLHRRYDGTCLIVAGTWHVSPHRCYRGRIHICLKDDRMTSPVAVLRTLAARVTAHDSHSLYQFLNAHLDWDKMYAFALIRNSQTPWCKMRKRRRSSHSHSYHLKPTTLLGLPSAFEMTTTPLSMKVVLFTHPEAEMQNRPDEPRRERQWSRSRIANYLFNFSRDVFRVDFERFSREL
ncbi:hypothetical protein JTE90_010244 [Oedothorax gibbosus]|nr:hypothetical protein JTE90_010244 [Oedothorax gibbosus]